MPACPICGSALTGTGANCLVCGADLSQARALMGDILAAPVASAARQKPPLAPPTRPSWIAAALAALLWGWAGAAILAAVMGSVMHFALGSDGGGYTALLSGINFGALLGFVIGSIWGVVSLFGFELGKASLTGAVMGGAETLFHYFAEWLLVAQPDVRAYLFGMMGCMAGAVAGACSVLLREYRNG